MLKQKAFQTLRCSTVLGVPTGRPDPSCQLEIQCQRPETAEVIIISAVLGTISGGQNRD